LVAPVFLVDLVLEDLEAHDLQNFRFCPFRIATIGGC